MTDMENRRNLRDLAFEVAAITTLIDYLTEKKEAFRAEFAVAAAEAGADASKAMLFGEEIAKISVVLPKPKAQVINERAFLTHVKTFHPTEIEETIRDGYRKQFMERLLPHDDGALDPHTGEVFDFIEFGESRGYISTRFQPEGRAKLIEAFKEHRVALAIGDNDEIQAIG